MKFYYHTQQTAADVSESCEISMFKGKSEKFKKTNTVNDIKITHKNSKEENGLFFRIGFDVLENDVKTKLRFTGCGLVWGQIEEKKTKLNIIGIPSSLYGGTVEKNCISQNWEEIDIDVNSLLKEYENSLEDWQLPYAMPALAKILALNY